jgi:hypothetical protein
MAPLHRNHVAYFATWYYRHSLSLPQALNNSPQKRHGSSGTRPCVQTPVLPKTKNRQTRKNIYFWADRVAQVVECKWKAWVQPLVQPKKKNSSRRVKRHGFTFLSRGHPCFQHLQLQDCCVGKSLQLLSQVNWSQVYMGTLASLFC